MKTSHKVPRALLALAAMSLITASAWAQSSSGSGLTYEEAADCTALLKQSAQSQASKIQSGDAQARDRLINTTKAGYAFVGSILKSGMNRKDGEALLEQAEARLERQGLTRSAELSKRCESVGADLLKKATSIERALVSHKAKQRVDSLLAKKSP